MNTRSLRFRLILSHIEPVLVILPLIGIALVYVLETQILLQNLSEDLTRQAEVVAASLVQNRTDVWTDPQAADELVSQISPVIKARVMILDASGYVVASSQPDQAESVVEQDSGQQPLDIPGVDDALAGNTSVRVDRIHYLFAEYFTYEKDTEVADVMVPVRGPDEQVMGIVRLTHEIDDIRDRFSRLRIMIGGILLVALVLSAGVGWLLALNLERPLQQVTQAVYGLAQGKELAVIREQGPDEIRLLVRAVNTLVERLQSLEKARRRLLANLVHELGRPLGALRSATQALLGGADQDPALRQELLVGMDESAARLQRLLEDLARLYDQVLGSLELDYQKVDVGVWLPRILSSWREAAQAKGLSWQTDIAAHLPVIQGDPDRLAQALGNLLSNAVKYTPSGGIVSVSAGVDEEKKFVWLCVGDTGPGIAPEEQDAVFSSFYRGHSAGGRFPQGMGLGLTIARDLVLAHHGSLTVDSAPGQGSRFTIRLPLAPINNDSSS